MRSRALVAWAGLGLLLAVGASAGPWTSLCPPSPREVAVWVQDQAAHAAFGLDEDGIVVTRRDRIPEPCAAPLPVPASWDLGGLTRSLGTQVVALEVDREWWGRARPGCWMLLRGELSEAAAALPQQGRFLERWVRTGRPLRWRRAFRIALPWTSRALASHPAGVWVAADRMCVLRFVSHSGQHRMERRLLDANGVDALACAGDASGGGVWAAAGGALVRLDRHGGRMPGQGGFAHLSMVRVAWSPR